MMCRLFLCVLLPVLLSGCHGDPKQFRYPNLTHPGHISEQQYYMNKFDPFVRADIGPKIDGDRPIPASLQDQTSGMKRYGLRYNPSN